MLYFSTIMPGGERFQTQVLYPNEQVLRTLSYQSHLGTLTVIASADEQKPSRGIELRTRAEQAMKERWNPSTFRDHKDKLVEAGLLAQTGIALTRTKLGTAAAEAFDGYRDVILDHILELKMAYARSKFGENNPELLEQEARRESQIREQNKYPAWVLAIAGMQSSRSRLYTLQAVPLPEQQPASIRDIQKYLRNVRFRHLSNEDLTGYLREFRDAELILAPSLDSIELTTVGEAALRAFEVYHMRLEPELDNSMVSV